MNNFGMCNFVVVSLWTTLLGRYGDKATHRRAYNIIITIFPMRWTGRPISWMNTIEEGTKQAALHFGSTEAHFPIFSELGFSPWFFCFNYVIDSTVIIYIVGTRLLSVQCSLPMFCLYNQCVTRTSACDVCWTSTYLAAWFKHHVLFT